MNVGLDRAQQLFARERLGEVMLRAHDAATGAVEQAVLAGQHDHRDALEDLVVLDQRARLVAVEPGHHDVDEDDVGLVVGYLGKRVEAIDGSEDLASFAGQQRFCRAADGLAVVDDEHLEPGQPWPAVAGSHVFHAVKPSATSVRACAFDAMREASAREGVLTYWSPPCHWLLSIP